MVTDPPYNIGYHYNEYGDALDDVEYWAFLQSVLRMPLVIIHYPESICRLAMVLRRVPEKVVAWVYQAGTPKQWRGSRGSARVLISRSCGNRIAIPTINVCGRAWS